MREFKYLLRKFLFTDNLDEEAKEKMHIGEGELQNIKLRRCDILRMVHRYNSVIGWRMERCKNVKNEVFKICSTYY